ncbi:GNAT family N-acetyltransferase [Arthrospiribacter ruber]|uniref:GNAT family N-acetyltransferase n=1 Tax=Arthrospiribacter ruber TaxID=2487934 RepID=A0A951MCH4_9BACT|nr:GNAT family N-acetyltransferase [Arthrospiribacter ruber]MBW3466386.1 GNAT family N-acetyltransferase [Arthrospiribacter ruber]
MSEQFKIRKARASDISNLIEFFIRIYGEHTVFQVEAFLKYYFQSPWNKGSILESNWIGLNSKDEIVSHYGGLHYKLILGENIIDTIWGVNAYTLPDWRGLGFNSTLVQKLFDANPINATLGMALDTHKFYKKLGYNVFDHQRLKRYLFLFREEAFELVNEIGADIGKAKQLVGSPITVSHWNDPGHIVELNSQMLENHGLQLGRQVVCTTLRDEEFLKWRFLDHPFIAYKVFAFVGENGITAYLALRPELLQPSGRMVGRIVDMYGDARDLSGVISFAIQWGNNEGFLYLDFSKIGELYDHILMESGFSMLEDDDVALFPQVSAPVAKRPNHEYLALKSLEYAEPIMALEINDIYFTRMDSDRDRVAKINQIK